VIILLCMRGLFCLAAFLSDILLFALQLMFTELIFVNYYMYLLMRETEKKRERKRIDNQYFLEWLNLTFLLTSINLNS